MNNSLQKHIGLQKIYPNDHLGIQFPPEGFPLGLYPLHHLQVEQPPATFDPWALGPTCQPPACLA